MSELKEPKPDELAGEMLMIKRGGWRRIMESAKVKTAIGGLAAMAISIVTTEPGNIQRWREFGWACVGTALALILAWAYEDGKLKEGMTGELTSVDLIPGQPLMRSMERPSMFPLNVAHSESDPGAASALGGFDSAADQPGKQNPRSGANGIERLGVLILGGLLLFSGGCMDSAPFQRAVKIGVPHVASVARGYAERDAMTEAFGPAERGRRIDQANALEASARENKPSVNRVGPAWDSVRPWYVAYVQGDTRLAPQEIKWRLDTAEQLTRLIDSERRRRRFFIPGG